MHEVSVAANIMNIVQEEMSRQPGRKVDEVHLQVGSLSGVIIDSLRFALDASRNDGVLNGAEIIIEECEAKVRCVNCSHEFPANDYFTVCPRCQGVQLDFLSGRELFVKSIVFS
jgi:hydrogenase nickel incorporation protein HypA/HybF